MTYEFTRLGHRHHLKAVLLFASKRRLFTLGLLHPFLPATGLGCRLLLLVFKLPGNAKSGLFCSILLKLMMLVMMMIDMIMKMFDHVDRPQQQEEEEEEGVSLSKSYDPGALIAIGLTTITIATFNLMLGRFPICRALNYYQLQFTAFGRTACPG